MDIQKIKELALANGFKLKEQASGNMDLHSYVYEFAQAVAVETINQAQLVFGQDGVTVFDTETLDSEISNISSEFEAEYFFDNDDADRLELLVAKAMKLGELYERQKWQQAKKSAVPEGFVLVENVHPDSIVHNQGLGLFRECMIIYGWKNKSDDFKDALNKGFYHGLKLGVRTVLEKAMNEAREPTND